MCFVKALYFPNDANPILRLDSSFLATQKNAAKGDFMSWICKLCHDSWNNSIAFAEYLN